MASPASPTTSLRAAARDRLAPSAAFFFQVGWLVLQLGALGLALAGTPALHDLYQTTCPDMVCSKLPQPTVESVQLLSRLGIPLAIYASVMAAVEWGWLLLWAGLGAVIAWKQPRDPVGMSLAYTGVAVGVGSFTAALSWAGSQFLLPDRVIGVVIAVTLPLMIGLFPDGRWVPRWTRWVGLAAIAHAVVKEIAAIPSSGQLNLLDLPVGEVMMAVMLGAQIYRYRRVSNTTQRQQAKWVLFGISMIILTQLLALGLYVLGLMAQYQLGLLVVAYGGEWLTVLAIGFAVLRHRLFDIDVIINRALVYGGLTAIVVALYALIVGGLGALLQAQGGLTISFLATGVIAVLFQPLRARLQRGVNRLLYGERDEPYAVVARLGRRLEASLAPDAVLPTIVETVAVALKLPYLAIVLPEEGGTVAAEYGTATPDAGVVVPLVYQGEAVGELRLAPRHGEQALTRADRRPRGRYRAPGGDRARATQLTRDSARPRAAGNGARRGAPAAASRPARRPRASAGESGAHRGHRPIAAGARPAGGPCAAQGGEGAVAGGSGGDSSRGLRATPARARRPRVGRRRATRRASMRGRAPLSRSRHRGTASPAAAGAAAFRIAQEAVANVARHAHARSRTVAPAVGATLR
ncbi:MAG: hypothetical protein U0232_16460 [Thermomicrobiales bacterium]